MQFSLIFNTVDFNVEYPAAEPLTSPKFSTPVPLTEEWRSAAPSPAVPVPLVDERNGYDNAIFFGIVFCTVAAAISALVLLISLPVFLFSSNAGRLARAGGLVKTTLGFFVGSAGTIIATITFAPS